jgi:hypothetical protein
MALALALGACSSMPNKCYVADGARWQFVPGAFEGEVRERDLKPMREPAPVTPARWRPAINLDKPGPRIGSPEWEREQAELARKDKDLAQKIQSICRGC